MTMLLWSCHFQDCPGDHDDPSRPVQWEGEVGVCPRCGADVRKPEYRGVVAKMERVHLLVKAPQGPIIGRGYRYQIACNSEIKALSTLHRGTGEPSAVTCPQCKATSKFGASAAENGFEGKAPRVVDPPGGG